MPSRHRIEEREPRVDERADGVEAELELRDHAEVATATGESPQQTFVLVLGRDDDVAVCRDDVGADQAVAREAELALEPATSAADREADDAGGGDPPTCHR